MALRIMLSICVFFCCKPVSFSQSAIIDSTEAIINVTEIVRKKPLEKEYDIGNGKIFIYQKPKLFSFLTKLPKDAAGIVVASFQKKSIKPLLWIAGTTALLLLNDEAISEGVGQFSKNINLSPEEKYKDVLNIKLGKTNTSLLKAPQNINTALYQLGQGFPSLLIGAGLYTYGKIHKDYRAVSTASQLTEAFILMGVGTQLIKRITGRQSPSEAVDLDGSWHPFPSFKNYQNHTPFYDAFPSGHIATLMSTVTILAENYPEKRWIKPVGYSVMGLVGYSMINNKVHWASDYPLAIALGYLCAKQVVKNNRKVINSSLVSKHKATISYTINYVNGRLMPGAVYKF
ncbi:MAG: phosphatase PAP2 family protein [Chitinophagaceae bacterium]